MVNPKLYIGTAGWMYKDWVPVFYPKQQSAKFDMLSYYSQYFNCVEVNSTFYTYIAPTIIEGWIRKVNSVKDFNFTIKLNQDFTHKKIYKKDNILLVQNNLDILHSSERLGGLLVQFPYSFGYNEANFEHLRKLIDIFGSYKCFIELRHSSWNNTEVEAEIKKNKICICTIDQPQIGESIKFEPIISGDIAYLRFHGRNYKEWFKNINSNEPQTYEQQSERYKYLYSPGELIEIVQKINMIKEKVKEIYIILNNHPVGNAPANAFELMHYLQENNNMDVPMSMKLAYPRLSLFS